MFNSIRVRHLALELELPWFFRKTSPSFVHVIIRGCPLTFSCLFMREYGKVSSLMSLGVKFSEKNCLNASDLFFVVL